MTTLTGFNDGSASSFTATLHDSVKQAILDHRNGTARRWTAFLCFAADTPVSMGIVPHGRPIPPCTGAPHVVTVPLTGIPSQWSPLSISTALLDLAADALLSSESHA